MGDLYEIFNFTDVDLKENREGRLSQSQCTRIRQSALIDITVSISGFGLLLFSLFRFIPLILNEESIFVSFFMIFFLFALLVGIIYNSLNAYNLWKAASKGEILVAKGRMRVVHRHRKTSEHGKSGRHYRLLVGGFEFLLDRKQYDYLIQFENQFCYVYYSPRLLKVMAIEILDPIS